jgi:phospholipid/cholesterol/gamma-HCH transport system substrate-binding protein
MKPETKVGLMFVTAFVAVVVFSYYLGAFNPFTNAFELDVAFNFAGGIEVGSPVRVMGIKVGKVKAIHFEPDLKLPSGEEVKLRLRVSVDKKAWKTLSTDSRFYINLAGVIGEKFLEITPGSSQSEPLKNGALVRGEDPPRIDQLISQSYGLAGKILNMVEKNEGSVVNIIDTMNRLVGNFDKALRQLDKTASRADINKMLKNMQTLTDDMAFFTQQLRSPEGQKTLALLNTLVRRLEPLDGKAIKKFMQEEGIKAKLF